MYPLNFSLGSSCGAPMCGRSMKPLVPMNIEPWLGSLPFLGISQCFVFGLAEPSYHVSLRLPSVYGVGPKTYSTWFLVL